MDSDVQSSSDESSPPSSAAPSTRRATSKPLSFTFLGTGGSSALPLISCVTNPEDACPSCFDTIFDPDSKNIRGNTGGVLRVPQDDGTEATILIDCGKTFREAALKWFVKKGLRRIDACLLTHLHADAIDGLDDLRAWTYKSAIEKTIPIYCTRTTYNAIASGFPYMISKKAASGGGALPSFDWQLGLIVQPDSIMPEDQDWQVCGITVTPFPFHHGCYFDTKPPRPLICSAFLIDSSILYASDLSYIPEEQWDRLATYVSLPSQNGLFPSSSLSRSRTTRPFPRLQAAILDVGAGLLSTPTSHIGLPHTIAIARRLGALRTYLTDFSHGETHQTWLEWCERFGRGECSDRARLEGRAAKKRVVPAWRSWTEGELPPPRPKARPTPQTDNPFALVPDPPSSSTFTDEHGEGFIRQAFEAVEEWAGGVLPGRWVRPACDGMTIEWDRWEEGANGLEWCDERVRDDEYDRLKS